jgi:hypothetical protein
MGKIMQILTLAGAVLFSPQARAGHYIETSLEGGLEGIYYNIDLGDKIQKTPLHPTDLSIVSDPKNSNYDPNYRNYADGVAADVESGKSGAFTARGKISYGTERIRAAARLHVRFSSASDEYRRGIFAAAEQQLPWRGSYAFTQVEPNTVALIPSAGAEIIFGRLTLDGEVCFPYTGFTVRSGHDRWGKWKTVQEENWKGFGLGFGAGILWNPDNSKTYAFGRYRREKYKPIFAEEEGDISGDAFSFGMGVRW